MAADPNRSGGCKLRPHEASCAGARRPGRGSHDGRDRVRRDTPPGAAISDSLQYVGRVPNSSHIVEGKFDTVMGRDVLVTTGTYGFRTYDVRDAAHPKALDTLQPPEVLGKNGYWQDEDMEIDTKRKLIIGALDPRHDDVDQTSCPGIGQLSAKNRNPKCRSGFYVISYKDPRNLRQVGHFNEVPAGHTTSCIDDCRYVWTGGPARRDDLAYLGPFEPGGARGRPADLGHGPPQSGEAAHVPQPDRPRSATTATRTTRTTWTSTATGSPGSAAAAACSATRPRAAGATRRPTASARRTRGIRCWWPAAASRAGTTASPSRRHGLHPQRDAADERARACGRGPQEQRGADDRGGLHGALRPGRPDRRRGHHELARRRGRHELDARAPVPDDRARLVPPGAQRGGLERRRSRRARRTTSSCRARRWPPPGTARDCG